MALKGECGKSRCKPLMDRDGKTLSTFLHICLADMTAKKKKSGYLGSGENCFGFFSTYPTRHLCSGFICLINQPPPLINCSGGVFICFPVNYDIMPSPVL